MTDEEKERLLDLPKRIAAVFDWPDAKYSNLYFRVQAEIAKWLEDKEITRKY